jgi:hypothetical protein
VEKESPMTTLNPEEFQLLSRAVVLWYRHYNVSPVEHRSAMLCREAVDLFRAGYDTSEEIADVLIDRYGEGDFHRLARPSLIFN